VGDMMLNIPVSSILGQGQYGKVWRARDRRTGVSYAIKNIAVSVVGPLDAERKQRLVRMQMNECEVANHIQVKPHPCIVQFFGVQHFSGVNLYSVVMELCPHGDLIVALKASRKAARSAGMPYTPPEQALHWLGQVFLGLEHLHKRMNILVRDLKPDNVVLNGRGHAKITDVGFARLGTDSEGLWTFGIPPGSPGYVSPEILQNETYDSSADLYSFGVLCWVVLTGGNPSFKFPCPPYSEIKSRIDYSVLFNDWQLLHQIVRKPQDFKGAVALSPAGKDFVLGLTQRKPRDRLLHDGIRDHELLQCLQLPASTARLSQVVAWLETIPHGARPPAGST